LIKKTGKGDDRRMFSRREKGCPESSGHESGGKAPSKGRKQGWLIGTEKSQQKQSPSWVKAPPKAKRNGAVKRTSKQSRTKRKNQWGTEAGD